MNFCETGVIPQYNFEECENIRNRYDILAKEHLSIWIKEQVVIPGKIFDYGEVRRQLLAVKTNFTSDVQNYVLACYEAHFCRNVFLPEILNWKEKNFHISLIAVLYTMPMEATPRHLISAIEDVDAQTGRSNGVVFVKIRIERRRPIVCSFKIKDYTHPERANIERC